MVLASHTHPVVHSHLPLVGWERQRDHYCKSHGFGGFNTVFLFFSSWCTGSLDKVVREPWSYWTLLNFMMHISIAHRYCFTLYMQAPVGTSVSLQRELFLNENWDCDTVKWISRRGWILNNFKKLYVYFQVSLSHFLILCSSISSTHIFNLVEAL